MRRVEMRREEMRREVMRRAEMGAKVCVAVAQVNGRFLKSILIDLRNSHRVSIQAPLRYPLS